MHKVCPTCKLANHGTAVECRHCGTHLSAPSIRPMVYHPQPVPTFAVHVPGGWCEHCGYVLHVYRAACPNCGSRVGYGQSAWSAYQPGTTPAISLRRPSRIAASTYADAALRFCVGLVGGITFSSMGSLLAWAGQTDSAVPMALAGWIVGLIAYRRTRRLDLLCSKGLGIGTLLGQLIFIAYASTLGIAMSFRLR